MGIVTDRLSGECSFQIRVSRQCTVGGGGGERGRKIKKMMNRYIATGGHIGDDRIGLINNWVPCSAEHLQSSFLCRGPAMISVVSLVWLLGEHLYRAFFLYFYTSKSHNSWNTSTFDILAICSGQFMFRNRLWES